MGRSKWQVIGLVLYVIAMITTLVFVAKGQTARVYILSPADAQKVSTAWIKLGVAQADWKATKTEIESKYHLSAAEAGSEWRWGIQFSDDFKAVVPAEQPK